MEPDGSASPLFDPALDRVTDASALGALAHPLRLRMLGLLRRHGPSTASRLAARVGESSGLTSYHLRQLADAGMIVDATAEDLGHVGQVGGRERWWKAARRSTYTLPPPPGDDAAAAATSDYLRAVLSANTDNTRSWLSVEHTWPSAWQAATELSDVPLHLTLEELRHLGEEIRELVARYRRWDPTVTPGTGEVPTDAVGVSVQYQVFPFADQPPPADPAVDPSAGAPPDPAPGGAAS